MLAVCILHLEPLATRLAGVRLLVDLQVCLQVLGAAEGVITFGTNAVVLLTVTLQVFAQILGESKLLLAFRARATVLAGLSVVAHNVPLQVKQSTKFSATIATLQDLSGMGLPVSLQFQPAAEALRTFGAAVLVLVPHVSLHVVGLGEGQGADWAAEGPLLCVSRHVSSQPVGVPKVPPDTNGTRVFPFFLWWPLGVGVTGITLGLPSGFTASIRTLVERGLYMTAKITDVAPPLLTLPSFRVGKLLPFHLASLCRGRTLREDLSAFSTV